MRKSLAVWLHHERSGLLQQDLSGRMSYSYDADASRPISLSMPLREEPYGDRSCEAFFGGLLPESEKARQLIGKRFGINGNNSFSLLSVIGRECAGAISIWPDEGNPAINPTGTLQFLEESELARQIRELPRRPLLVDIEGMRLSLAGAGDKTAVCVVDDQIALPPSGMPSSHILKSNINELGNTVANEFFCMRLAEKLGIKTATVELRRAEDINFLLVERYDRETKSGGATKRIHQEDFCQALGIVSANKYQNEGGPTYKDCFDLLRGVARPAVDRTRMVDNIIFNFLIGNMDAHGKNFSILHDPSLLLAPLYDVLATRIYSDLSPRLAMKVDKYYRAEDIFPRHWKRLCEACGINYPGFRKVFIETTRRIAGVAEELRDALNDYTEHQATFNAIVSFIYQNAELTSKRFAIDKAENEEL